MALDVIRYGEVEGVLLLSPPDRRYVLRSSKPELPTQIELPVLRWCATIAVHRRKAPWPCDAEASHGEDLFATEIEETIIACPSVSGVLVGGQGRAYPFLLVEWNDGVEGREDRMKELWPFVEQANRRCSDLVKLTRDKVVFGKPEKKLVRNVKGTVIETESEKLYANEIEARYS